MSVSKIKICFIAPHLSTGGMPAFLLKRIQTLLKYTKVEIFVIEWCDYSPIFIVQKQQIKKLVGDNFFNLGSIGNPEKGVHGSKKDLIKFLYDKNIDIIHLEEIPEGFDSWNPFNPILQKEIYNPKHPWRIVETCHNMYFTPDTSKLYNPDGYACVTPYHVNSTFKNQKVDKSLITFPIDPLIQHKETKNKLLEEIGYRLKGEFHIINVGLWTPGKNQNYALEIAQSLYDKYGFTYIFHFIGNQAPNFKEYWEPLQSKIPPNVNVWGERKDVDKFFKFADLMLFTSNWECNPIVLKEAISNNIKIMAYDLEHYGDEYKPFIVPLTGDTTKDSSNLIDTIFTPTKYNISDSKDSTFNFAVKHINFYKSLLDDKTKRQ
tara:strand:+ start:323 stop:1450 length:1128 start_codon:yes stop_codon:yes gene_type:complete